MKKTIAFLLMSATALGGTLAYAHAQETTSGSTLSPTSTTEPHKVSQFKKGHKLHMLKNIERSKENIENGVKITMTSTDPEVVTKLQSDEMKHPPKKGKQMDDVSMTKNNIPNGVEIVMTSTNPETVTKLQAGPKPFEREAMRARKAGK